MNPITISGRHIKPENEKKIKLIAMYLILLEEGKVYDFELGFHSDNKSDQRTFERYAKELYEAGAIPKPYIKKQREYWQGEETILYYYDLPEVKLYPLQTENKVYDKDLKRWFSSINPNKPIAENEYMKAHHFLYQKNKPTSKRLARILALIYSNRTVLTSMKLKSGITREEKYYFEKLNPGASYKTWQRDRDLYLYAVYYYKKDPEDIRKRHAKYLKELRDIKEQEYNKLEFHPKAQ